MSNPMHSTKTSAFWVHRAFAIAAILFSMAESRAQITSTPIAVSGLAAPGGGAFLDFSNFSINNTGQIAFVSNVSGGPTQGLYLFHGSGISSVARQGQLSPGGGSGEAFATFSNVALNNSGHVAFQSVNTTTGGVGGGGGIYLHNGTSVLPRVLLGQVSPVSPFEFIGLGGRGLNDNDQVALIGSTDRLNHFVHNGSNLQFVVSTFFRAPNNGGIFSSISNQLQFNNSGQTAFFGVEDNTTDGVYFFDGGANSLIAREGNAAPSGGTFTALSSPLLNNQRQIAFTASTTVGSGVFFHTGTALQSRAVSGGSAPGGGTFAAFQRISLSDSGTVAIQASTNGGPGAGIYLGRLSGLTAIALQGSSAPGGGTFGTMINNPMAINAADQVAFVSNTSTGVGLFATDPLGQLVSVVQVGRQLSGGAGTVASIAFADESIGNGMHQSFADSGYVLYRANFSGGNQGLYRADVGHAIVDSSIGNGSGNFLLNDGSTRSLYAGKSIVVGQSNSGTLTITNGSKVLADFVTLAQNAGSTGAIVVNGATAQLTARQGLTVNVGGRIDLANAATLNAQGVVDVNGGRITNLANSFVNLAPGTLLSIRNSGVVNLSANALTIQNGQLMSVESGGLFETAGTMTVGNAGIVRLSGGRLNLGGIVGANGQFNFESGQLNLTASTALDNSKLNLILGSDRQLRTGQVLSASAGTLTISGDLEIDGGSLLGTGASLSNSGTLYVRRGLVNPSVTFTNSASGSVQVDNGATVHGTSLLSNSGEIFLNGSNAKLSGGLLSNNGTIRGTGTIQNSLSNNAAGEIQLTSGNRLRFSGAANTNAGLLDLVGGEIQFSAPVDNLTGTGIISARNAILRFNGGLNNNGGIGFSYGTSDVFGKVFNAGRGVINVSGGSQVTFYDDVDQQNQMFVAAVGSQVSSAVLFGDFSGPGGFVGGGNVFALGDLRPGNSPASVLMGGNLFLGNSTHSYFELGGQEVGEFDQLLVSGDLTLAGRLAVNLINGFQLRANSLFLIANVAGSRFGTFAGLDEGGRVGNFGGKSLFITYSAGDGNDVALFTAIPESTACWLVIPMAWVAGLSVRRKRLARMRASV